MTQKEFDAKMTVDEDDMRFRHGFKDMDTAIVSGLSNRQLAILQSEVKRDSPQFLFAESEWKRRASNQQLKLQKVAIISSVIGLIVGWILRGFGWI